VSCADSFSEKIRPGSFLTKKPEFFSTQDFEELRVGSIGRLSLLYFLELFDRELPPALRHREAA
jgi:hypothetical protein